MENQMDYSDAPSWKAVISAIIADMRVPGIDAAALNLISLGFQQECLSILKATADQAAATGKRCADVVDARVACHTRLDNYFIHPQLLEDSTSGLQDLINSQPFPETFEDPALLDTANLSAATWTLNESVPLA